jgi:hypothetical protein
MKSEAGIREGENWLETITLYRDIELKNHGNIG